jgi:UDP-N-acetylglucosamine transferase subunit ALG13
MIFVTIGTHPGQFDRLLRRIDEIAPKIKEEIVIQRGFTKYSPKNCKYFDFVEDIEDYYKKARLVIVQSATSLLEFCIKYPAKPVITVPRQARYKEHLNDHQGEFGEYFAKKTGIKCVIDIQELTPELLKEYNTIAKVDFGGKVKLQKYFKNLFLKISKEVDHA